MREAKILLIEGDGAGSLSLVSALTRDRFSLSVVHSGRLALEAVDQALPHLIVFHAASMRSSGVRSCRRLRKSVGDIPIIHTRSSGMPEDGSAEADIYLQVPFTPRKLLNRVKALLPADATEEEIVRAGHITLFKGKRSVEINGYGEKRLTPKLANLLEEFLRNPNSIVSRPQLMHNVWHTDYVGDTRTLDVHIRWVRELIEADPSNPRFLRTVRGKGYIFSTKAET